MAEKQVQEFVDVEAEVFDQTAITVAPVLNLQEMFNGELPKNMATSAPADSDPDYILSIMGDGDNRISEHVGERFTIQDFFIEMVKITNSRTGQIEEAPRCNILDTDGKIWHATSTGIMNALMKIYYMKKEKPAGTVVEITQTRTSRGNNVNSLKVIPQSESANT